MKIKIIVAFVLFVNMFMTCLLFEAAAINTDGFLNETEWKNAQPIVLVTKSDAANCDVENGIVYIFCDEPTDRIYIGFKVKLTDYVDESNYYGVSVSVGSVDFIKITQNGISSYDTDQFSVEAKISAYSQTAFGVEAVIGVKYGLSAVDSVKVRFIDAEGVPSNVYTVKLPYNTVTESETVQSQQPITDSGLSGENFDNTTKVKTTKPKTTKRKASETYDKDNHTKAPAVNKEVSGQANQLSQEETTVLTVRQVKMQKGFTYAAVTALILLALGICVVVNLVHDKDKKKK